MADRYDLTMDWTEEWWRERALQGWKTDPFVYGWERDGDLRGICAYSFDDDADDADETVMRVTDVAADDDVVPAAALCPQPRLAGRRGPDQAPPDAPLLDLVEDPAPSTARSEPGRWSGSSMPPPRSKRSTPIRRSRPRSRFRFPTRSSTGTTRRSGSPSLTGRWRSSRRWTARSTSQKSMGPRPRTPRSTSVLSQLYVGYTSSVDEAVRSDGLAVGSALADDLRAVFPPRTTHLREGF